MSHNINDDPNWESRRNNDDLVVNGPSKIKRTARRRRIPTRSAVTTHRGGAIMAALLITYAGDRYLANRDHKTLRKLVVTIH